MRRKAASCAIAGSRFGQVGVGVGFGGGGGWGEPGQFGQRVPERVRHDGAQQFDAALLGQAGGDQGAQRAVQGPELRFDHHRAAQGQGRGVGVPVYQVTQPVCERAHLLARIALGWGLDELGPDLLDDPVEHGVLAVDVVVERHRGHA
jgi:hypothetical protein